jgi:hypothetical protein
MPRMSRWICVFSLLMLVADLTGCSTYNIGSDHDEDGSYAGHTLNSPVTDQNPYAGGGGASYPGSTDTGKPEQPIEKTTY